MATAHTASATVQAAASGGGPDLLVSVPPLPGDALRSTLRNVTAAFPDRSVTLASPDVPHDLSDQSADRTGGPRVVTYTPSAPPSESWLLTSANFRNLAVLAREYHAGTSLLLGPETQSLSPEALHNLAQAVAGGADVAVPFYHLHAREALVNSAILYPLSRALFATAARFPLAIDLGLSFRAVERLSNVSGHGGTIVWPIAEAAAAGLTIVEIDAGQRVIPTPPSGDLNAVLAEIVGSLFAEIDARATFWQRSRPIQPLVSRDSALLPSSEPAANIQPMINSFRNAYTNLHEIWSILLPPHTLLGLKKLSLADPATFHLPDSLWTRIVYDFTLAYRLRTINRGHLMGALTPLYLAWVASHLVLIGNSGAENIAAERHIEELARNFEQDRAYLVSRWRWPDRFNP